MDKKFHENFLRQYGRYKSEDHLKRICFKALLDSYERVKMIKGISKLIENRIRDEFIIDLEKNNEIIGHAIEYDIIVLIPESYDPLKHKRSDIRFKITHCCELIFECKKLSSAEQRYLNDGLIRFIRLDYAENENEGGMIGFILNSSIPSRLKKRVKNFYIVQFIDKPVSGYPNSFQSVHRRNNATKIKISHLFFTFKN